MQLPENYPRVDNWKEALDVALNERGQPKSMEDAFKICAMAAVLLLMNKQVKYGKKNILEFREAGLAIRMNDKLERIKNGSIPSRDEEGKLVIADLGKEGFEESFGDEAGYGFLGMCLQRGWFELPLLAQNTATESARLSSATGPT